MSSSQSQFANPSSSSSSTTDQDELLARRKLEQKRRFQQKQANAPANMDSFMQSMFSDLKLQSKTNTQTFSGKIVSLHLIYLIRSIVEPTKPLSLVSGMDFLFFLFKI